MADCPICMKWPEIPGIEFGFSWDISINNWLVCRDALKDPSHRTVIKAVLTTDQIKSLIILDEWWIFEESIDKERLDEWVRRRYFPSDHVENHSYRDALFRLFYWEFFYESDSSDTGADGKVHFYGGMVRRQRAANIAAAQRTAAMSFSISVSGDQGCGERCIIGETPIPACFRACPWLDSTKNTKEYPYYLWDIQTMSTVRCPPNGADYLVVSHTWGRWRVVGEGAAIPGVPWLVPRNTVFDVADLPEILSNVPFKTRYVWFDLVCIPQDGSPRMASEISRQAAIFVSAKWATIWFNRLDSWSGLRAAVAWLGYTYLAALQPINHDVAVSVSDLEVVARHRTELTRFVSEEDLSPTLLHFPWEEGSSRKYMVPDGWFTSLWTLQEACLRPDLYLCNKDWQLFSAGESTMDATPLDHIIALVNATLPKIPRNTTLPFSVHEICGIFMKTAMSKLLEMSPADVLACGNQRYCQDTNRAIAIMSALGTTDWYTAYRHRASETEESELTSTFVHRIYPLEFVNEVKARFGGLLFSVVDSSNLDPDFYKFSWWSKNMVHTELEATMMPFTLDIRRQRFSPLAEYTVDSDPTIGGWVINVDGSVDITEASVVAAFPQTVSNNLNVTVCAIVPGKNYFRGDVRLDDWLGSFRPKSQKYALGLFTTPHTKHSTAFGLLLERVYTKRDRNDFIKIRIFYFHVDRATHADTILPPSQPVGLKVL